MTNLVIRSITLPNNFFTGLEIYLRTSGADTMQQKKLIEWIKGQAIIEYEPEEKKEK